MGRAAECTQAPEKPETQTHTGVKRLRKQTPLRDHFSMSPRCNTTCAESELITDQGTVQEHSVKRGPDRDSPPSVPGTRRGERSLGQRQQWELQFTANPLSTKEGKKTAKELNMSSSPGAAKTTLFNCPGH